MTRRFIHVTYDTTTPESAERGDYADCGFCTPYGRVSLEGKFGAEAGAVKAECALTLQEALHLFGYRYGRRGLEESGVSFYQPDAHTVNYRNGEQERLALHLPDNVSDGTYARVKRLLEGEG